MQFAGNGWKLDIAMTSCLTNYIKGTFKSIGGGKWQSGSGNVYYDEGYETHDAIPSTRHTKLSITFHHLVPVGFTSRLANLFRFLL